MEERTDNKDTVMAGGRYARSEEELFDKAVALLDKCKVTTGASGQEKVESSARTS
jgi:hypothetical protein